MNKTIIRFFLIFSLSLCCFGGLLAQKYSNEFLAIGVGAKAQAMGNSMVATVNDVTAGFWNPAGLLSPDLQVSAMHAEWFAGIAQYDYLGISKALSGKNNRVVGLTAIRFGIDQIPYTINLVDPDGSINYDNVTEFSAADYGFLFSYAQDLPIENLRIGGSFKLIRRIIGDFGGAWGFGTDVGLQYQAGKWKFGLMAKDLTTTFNAWSFELSNREKEVFQQTGNEIPESSIEITNPRIVLGAAYPIAIGANFDLLLALDLDITTDGKRNTLIKSDPISMDPHFGLEASYKKYIFLRAGLNNVQYVQDLLDPSQESISIQPNFGVGIKLGRLNIDYALTNIGNVSEVLYSHIFSVVYQFKPRNEGS